MKAETDVSLDSLVAAISHDSTGLSPKICDRLQKACLELGDSELTQPELRARLQLRPQRFQELVRVGVYSGALESIHIGGQQPSIVRVDRPGLARLGSKGASTVPS